MLVVAAAGLRVIGTTSVPPTDAAIIIKTRANFLTLFVFLSVITSTISRNVVGLPNEVDGTTPG